MLLLAEVPEGLRAVLYIIAYVLFPAAVGFFASFSFGAYVGAIIWLVILKVVLLFDQVQKSRDKKTWETRAMPGVLIALIELLWPNSDLNRHLRTEMPGEGGDVLRSLEAAAVDSKNKNKKGQGGIRRRRKR